MLFGEIAYAPDIRTRALVNKIQYFLTFRLATSSLILYTHPDDSGGGALRSYTIKR